MEKAMFCTNCMQRCDEKALHCHKCRAKLIRFHLALNLAHKFTAGSIGGLDLLLINEGIPLKSFSVEMTSTDLIDPIVRDFGEFNETSVSPVTVTFNLPDRNGWCSREHQT